jgi:excisionase family DNA binding protein
MIINKDVYTVDDVAKILKVSFLTVRIWIRNKKIKATKVSKLLRIPEEVLERLLDIK